jgi:hypothetical protein
LIVHKLIVFERGLGTILFRLKDLLRVYGIRKSHKMLIVSFVYLISWLRAYWLIFRRKSFEKIWERIETTKIKIEKYILIFLSIIMFDYSKRVKSLMKTEYVKFWKKLLEIADERAYRFLDICCSNGKLTIKFASRIGAKEIY